jgi:hypothetical protein
MLWRDNDNIIEYLIRPAFRVERKMAADARIFVGAANDLTQDLLGPPPKKREVARGLRARVGGALR